MAVAATVIDMPTAPLDLQTRVGETRTTVFAGGELDAHTVRHLRLTVQRVLESNPLRLRLDLSTVTFVDSTGLGALVGIRRAAAAAGVPFEIVPSSRLDSLLQRTGLVGFFDLA